MSLNSRLITLNNGVASIGTRPIDELISNSELAERLEIAEEVLQLRALVKSQLDHINQLKAETIAGVNQLDKLHLQAGDLVLLPDDIEQDAVQMLINHVRDTLTIKNIGFVMGDIAKLSDDDKAQLVAEQIEQRVAQMRSELVNTKQENQHLHDYNAELQSAGDELGKQLDAIKDDNRRLAINLTTAERKTTAALTAKTEAEKQLKELKKLNPERLRKQVAELKKANKEKQTAIEALRKQNHEFVRDNNAKAKTIAQLDIALEKACDDINEQNTPEPIDVINCGNMGKWNVYGTRRVNCYDVMDVKNDVSMRLHVENGVLTVPDLRTPPKSLQKKIIDRAARYVATEKRIEDDQKPLEQGAV